MTDVEFVRLNVRDDAQPYTFETTTIEAVLAQYNSDINLASSYLWLIRAGDAAKRNFKFKVDGREVDKTMTAKECREQSSVYRDLAMLTPGDAIAEVDWTASFEPPEGG
ncbi:MAG: hypothetical protein ACYCX4_02645 [Bacillota bacterium]